MTKWKLYFIGLILISSSLFAQINYTVYSIPFSPFPFNVGDSVPIQMVDDHYSSVIPIGFDFFFYGQIYDSLVVSTNGYITFNQSVANTYSPWSTYPIPSQSVPKNSIFAPWHDTDPSIAGQIKYFVSGNAPYRKFVLNYYNVPLYLCNNLIQTSQIVLCETTNYIESFILEKPFCSTFNDGNAIHGIIDSTGNNATVVPGRNNWFWMVNEDGKRFDPGTYNAFNNLLSGKVFQDLNSNCSPDSNELGIANRLILVNGGDFYTYTDANGDYSFLLDTGTYVILETGSPYYNLICPVNGNYIVHFTAPHDSSMNNNFSQALLANCSDLTIDILAPNLTPCSIQEVFLNYCNVGTQSETGVLLNFSLNDSLQIINSSSNINSLGNNNYQIFIDTLQPGQCGNSILHVQVGCDSVASVYCIEAYIQGIFTGDCDSSNNHSTDCQTLNNIENSNNLRVAAQQFNTSGYVIADDIDNNDELTYLIRFQNNLNDTVNHLKIRDYLPSQLNPASIVLGSSSHSYVWFMLVNNELMIDFANINLPDSATDPINSRGYIKITLQQNSANPPGSVIINKARIFFDNNLPLVTNQTFNTINLDIGVPLLEGQDAQLFPNPVNHFLQLVLPFTIVENTSIEIFDVIGKSVIQQKIINAETNIDCSKLSKGIYILRITKNGVFNAQYKFVKD